MCRQGLKRRTTHGDDTVPVMLLDPRPGSLTGAFPSHGAISPALAAPRTGCSTSTSTGVSLLLKVVAERPGAGWLAQLGHRLRFDLSDALSADPMDVADLIEGARWAAGEPESQPDNAGLPLG